MKKKFTFVKKLRYNRLHNEFLVSIPSKIRDRIDLEEGEFVKVELEDNGKIIITKNLDSNESNQKDKWFFLKSRSEFSDLLFYSTIT